MKPIHNLLRQRLYRAQKPIIEHPPIDLLSAFTEKALSGSDHATVLEHLANCGDCRQIIFLTLPEGAAELVPLRTAAAKSSWISYPVVRWGTAAACAVIVVAAMRLHPGRVVHPEFNEGATQSQAGASKIDHSVPGTVATAVNSALPPTATRRDGPPAARKPAMPGKAKDVPHGLTGNFPAEDTIARRAATLTQPRWTLTAAGALQRSLDGGITWQKIQVSREKIFRSVAADGLSVWLGGEKGVLFHSADAGRHWKQVVPAGVEHPTSDITGIQFEDDLHGKLTTASNESWTTSDAGRSWQKR